MVFDGTESNIPDRCFCSRWSDCKSYTTFPNGISVVYLQTSRFLVLGRCYPAWLLVQMWSLAASLIRGSLLAEPCGELSLDSDSSSSGVSWLANTAVLKSSPTSLMRNMHLCFAILSSCEDSFLFLYLTLRHKGNWLTTEIHSSALNFQVTFSVMLINSWIELSFHELLMVCISHQRNQYRAYLINNQTKREFHYK